MPWPCETRTSTWRSFATISSGLYRFLAIVVLLDIKDIPLVGPLQWGRIIVFIPAPGRPLLFCRQVGREAGSRDEGMIHTQGIVASMHPCQAPHFRQVAILAT